MITGKQFNKDNENTCLNKQNTSRFVMLSSKTDPHKELLNEHPGLKIYKYEKFPMGVYNLTESMVFMWDVCVPDDAQVKVNTSHMECNKLILSNKQPIWTNNENCLLAVKFDGLLLYFIENQTDEICIEAVKQNDKAFGFVNDQNDNVCEELLKLDGLNIQHIVKQNPNLCTCAVKQTMEALKFVEQTEEICLLAVQLYADALNYIENKTDQVCLMAVQSHIEALKYANQTDEVCSIAIQKCPDALKYIKNQTQKLCLDAIKINRNCFKYVDIEFRTECKAYIKSNRK